MNLVLIGYRGSGKSTIANRLGERLGWEVWHLDDLIEQSAEMSIQEIVEREGWDEFRERESRLVQDACARTGIVVDCGGGVILRNENIQALRSTGRIVFLSCDPEILAKRIDGDSNRPSLTGKKSSTDEIIEVLADRLPLYEEAAGLKIDTGANDVETCVNLIYEWYNDPAYDL